jgi:NMT1/THI5 like
MIQRQHKRLEGYPRSRVLWLPAWLREKSKINQEFAFMKVFVRGLAIGGLLALLGQEPAFAQEKILYLNDWLPAGDKAPVYIAVAKGLFAAEGLEVTIQSGRGSSDVVTKLGTGVADMGQGGISALLQAKSQSGIPVTAIYSIYTKQPDAIFTSEGSGISSLKDLAGKKNRNGDVFCVECLLAARTPSECSRSGESGASEG